MYLRTGLFRLMDVLGFVIGLVRFIVSYICLFFRDMRLFIVLEYVYEYFYVICAFYCVASVIFVEERVVVLFIHVLCYIFYIASVVVVIVYV